MPCKNVRIKLCLLEAKLTRPSKVPVYNDPECRQEPEARAKSLSNEGQHLISDTQLLPASFDTLKRGCVNLTSVHASS